MKTINDKLAVFQVVSNGIDGRGKTSIVFSSLHECDRDSFYNNLGKNKCYYSTVDVVLSMSKLGKDFINKLDGNDFLVLQECLGFDVTCDSLISPIGDQNYTFYDNKTKTK